MSIAARIKEVCMEALFPTDGRCVFCSRLLLFEGTPFCFSCIEKIPYIRDAVCSKCGKEERTHSTLCHDCSYSQHFYKEGTALISYTPDGRKIIQGFKFYGNKKLAHYMGRKLGERVGGRPWIKGIDLILPVPLHPNRLRERGFNQSLLISEGVSSQIGIPLGRELLIRIKDTPHQTDLPKVQRMRNIKGAFCVQKPSKVEGRIILLIDDVYTTGATIDACAQALLEAGAQEVYFAAVAIGRGSS